MKNITLFILMVLFSQFSFSQTMTVYKTDHSTQSFQLSQIDSITFSTTVDTTLVTLVSNAKHSIAYKIIGDKIIFILKSNQENAFNVFIDVDVNQNSIIDAYYDRSYSSDGSGICSQYRIDLNSWTTCGGAPSSATASKSNNYYTFTIPLSELESSASSTSISVGFWFWGSLNGYTYYPGNEYNFSEMFVIKTK